MILPTSFDALVVGSLTYAMSFTLNRSKSRALAVGLCAFITTVALTIPGSMAQYTLKTRRISIETELRELQRKSAQCLRIGGPCSSAELARVRSIGCTALNGVVDTSWPEPCLLTREATDLTSDGGLALAVFREDDGPPDIWLVRPEFIATVGPTFSQR
jgi:hypothetical protein